MIPPVVSVTDLDDYNHHSNHHLESNNTSMIEANDADLIRAGKKLVQAQETRNLFRELDKNGLSTRSTRIYDDRLSGELKSGLDYKREGLFLSKTAMDIKLRDANRAVRQTNRLFEEEKRRSKKVRKNIE